MVKTTFLKNFMFIKFFNISTVLENSICTKAYTEKFCANNKLKYQNLIIINCLDFYFLLLYVNLQSLMNITKFFFNIFGDFCLHLCLFDTLKYTLLKTKMQHFFLFLSRLYSIYGFCKIFLTFTK